MAPSEKRDGRVDRTRGMRAKTPQASAYHKLVVLDCPEAKSDVAFEGGARRGVTRRTNHRGGGSSPRRPESALPSKERQDTWPVTGGPGGRGVPT